MKGWWESGHLALEELTAEAQEFGHSLRPWFWSSSVNSSPVLLVKIAWQKKKTYLYAEVEFLTICIWLTFV